jgi:uncharacterized membrane protein
MQAEVRSEVEIAAPAREVWDYVTDWPRQGEWIPFTRVEVLTPGGSARAVGGRFRAWTGLGRVGFWDPMTITAWEELPDGSARCEVLHRGRVVRGDGEFAVSSLGASRSRFSWWERLEVPAGVVGALGWRLLGPGMERGVDLALRRLARAVESGAARRSS